MSGIAVATAFDSSTHLAIIAYERVYCICAEFTTLAYEHVQEHGAANCELQSCSSILTLLGQQGCEAYDNAAEEENELHVAVRSDRSEPSAVHVASYFHVGTV